MGYQMTEFEKEMEASLVSMKNAILDKLSKSDNDFRGLVGLQGKDSIDLACDDMASKKMEAISRMDAGRLNAVEQALTRLRGGVYGRCASCGKKIPEERLRALPYALLCIDCKNQSEKR